YERHIEHALGSLLRSRMRSWEVIIVDDGSSDASLERAAGWIEHHDSVPALLLRHPINRALGHARTAARGSARAPHCSALAEDYDLWVRMAAAGRGGVHVPRIVARYRASDHSMLSVTNISSVEARSVIAEAAPVIMAPADN